MLWRVKYFIEKAGQKRPRVYTTEIKADTYTEAYLKFVYENPRDFAIKELYVISA